MTSARKKLPPYAKAIDDARRKGMAPARGCMGHIAIGFEWRRNIVPDFPVVVVPPGRDPADFDWRFTAGLDIFIMHSDRDIPHLQALCSALFAVKAQTVQTFNMDKVCRGEDHAWLQLRCQPGAPFPWALSLASLWKKPRWQNQSST
ncbi:MAG: hypothetical protein A2143_01810 [Gallionellales bacterium RBG_16_57_15]|nr:MAG: hypothetical protein A2143_01810 [Gallionellales bacterium RBG_16_57_15]